jgi:hypothetical protein
MTNHGTEENPILKGLDERRSTFSPETAGTSKYHVDLNLIGGLLAGSTLESDAPPAGYTMAGWVLFAV